MATSTRRTEENTCQSAWRWRLTILVGCILAFFLVPFIERVIDWEKTSARGVLLGVAAYFCLIHLVLHLVAAAARNKARAAKGPEDEETNTGGMGLVVHEHLLGNWFISRTNAGPGTAESGVDMAGGAEGVDLGL